MENIEEIKEKIRHIIKTNIDLKEYKAFFFGSRVTGKARNSSDFDVGIMGEKEVPMAVMGKIKDELDSLKTLYSVDVVDFYFAGNNFKKVALKSKEDII